MVSNYSFSNLIFVSAIRTPYKNSTSTNLMTESIIRGLKDNGLNVTFVAICKFVDEKEEVEEYFSKIVDKVIVVPSFYTRSTNSYKHLLSMLKSVFFLHRFSYFSSPTRPIL